MLATAWLVTLWISLTVTLMSAVELVVRSASLRT